MTAPVLLADDPEAYIPGDRRRALAAGRQLPLEVSGAALFVDISGFTPLSEALAGELGSQRASEVLSGHLNRVFHALIAELHRFGGDVIYFSGDAVTCWLDGDDGAGAVAAAFAMQAVMTREGVIETPGGSSHRLALKAAVAVGDARRFVVGDPEIQLLDVLAGRLVDRLVDAERYAEKGDVVADEAALRLLGDRVEVRERRGSVGVIARIRGGVDDRPLPAETERLETDLVRPWLLPPVFERLSTGRGEFLAELRPAYPLFVSFGGIDYDGDADASAKLDDFVQAAQRILAAYGGYLLQLTLGDKGAHVYAVFGTPVAHEDDAARACAAALALRGLDGMTAARDLHLGLTYGRLCSGTYGHSRRRTFACLGDAVNLSARLMSAAPTGAIYVHDSVRRSAGDRFEWGVVRPLALKGKREPVAAHALLGERGTTARKELRYRLPMVGRAEELLALESRLERAIGGSGSAVGLSAEAGMGKSRLVAEFVRLARARGLLVAYGECQSFGANSAYLPWREICRTLFGIDESLPAPDQVARLDEALAAIDPQLRARAPLLGPILELPIPDTDLTRSLDAKVRKTSLESLVAQCVGARCEDEPVVLVVEDAHWLDDLSRDLLEVVSRTLTGLRAVLLVSYRPEQGGAARRLPLQLELELSELGDEAMALLVEAKVGSGEASGAALLELVLRRAQGNPFYAEELINFVRSQGVDADDARALRALELPDSLHSLILSRIDKLTERPRRTLKVASVIGRSFHAATVQATYPELGSPDVVTDALSSLGGLDLVARDRAGDDSYVFKHVVTQEVAYESIPFGLRATLHGNAGRLIEAAGPDAIDRSLDLLAHHFWHGDDEEKKRVYLRRAGEAARAAYANTAAIDYFERLLPLLEGDERVEVLLELGPVLEIVGDWARAQAVEEEALMLAEAAGDTSKVAWCEAALAEVARKRGAFDEALERLARAESQFESIGDDAGVGRVLHIGGTVAAQRGDVAGARARYAASLSIRERLGDAHGMAAVLSNLGIMAEWEGNFEHGLGLHERAVALQRERDDRWGIAASMTNIGMNAMYRGEYGEAASAFREAMRLNQEVGDLWMVALSHHNLGNAARDVGDAAAAAAQYASGVKIYTSFDDAWALAQLLEDIVILLARAGRSADAAELLGAADRLRDECGSPRGDQLEAELTASVTEAHRAARERGRALALAAAGERASEALVDTEAAAP